MSRWEVQTSYIRTANTALGTFELSLSSDGIFDLRLGVQGVAKIRRAANFDEAMIQAEEIILDRCQRTRSLLELTRTVLHCGECGCKISPEESAKARIIRAGDQTLCQDCARSLNASDAQEMESRRLDDRM